MNTTEVTSVNVYKNTRGLVEAGILTSIICIFAFVGMYIPLLSFFLIFVPLPLIVLGVRRNLKFTILSTIASSLIIMSISNPLSGIYIIAFPGIAAIVIIALMKRNFSHKAIMFSGTVASIVTTMVSYAIASKILGISMIEKVKYVIEESLEIQKSMLISMNADPELLASKISELELVSNSMILLIPMILISASFLTVYINYTLVLKVLKRTGTKVAEMDKFRYFKLSKNTMTGMLVIYLLTMLVSSLNIVNNEVLIINISLLN